MKGIRLSKRHSLALEALQEAGQQIKEDFYKYKNKRNMLLKRSENISTSTDIKSENIIINIISESFSKDTIISEESETKETKSDYVWIIDPLDGTSNFFMNIPYFGSCLSIQFQGETQFAGIYNPLNQDLAFAIKNKGAFLNNQSIEIQSAEQKSEKLTGFYIQGYGIEKNTEAEIYKILLFNCKRVLNHWAPSIDWLNLLQGNGDFIINYHTESEDFVPGAFIYEEAGGKVESWTQQPIILNLRKHRRVTAIAAHPSNMDEVRSIISKIQV